MTTTQPDAITDALEALAEFEGLTAEALAQPFIDWTETLDAINMAAHAAMFPLGVDPEVHERASRLLAVLTAAAALVDYHAMACLLHDDMFAAMPVRSFFEHATGERGLRRELFQRSAPTAEYAAEWREGQAQRAVQLQARRDQAAAEMAQIDAHLARMATRQVQMDDKFKSL